MNRTLFVNRTARNVGGVCGRTGDEYVDVVSDPVKPVPPYDPRQARKVMDECDRFVEFANPRHGQESEVEDELENWEDGVVSTAVTVFKNSILILVIIITKGEGRLDQQPDETAEQDGACPSSGNGNVMY